MERLSYNRLKMLFKHDWESYWKGKAVLAGIIFGFTVLAYSMVNVLPGLSFALISLLVWVLVLSPSYFCSHIFANMRTKQQRISFLMLPATREEKYLVRFVDYAIAPSIIIFVTLAITLAILYPFSSLRDLDLGALWELSKAGFSQSEITYELRTIACMIATVITASLAWMSAFVLGGTIFNKHAMAKTLLAIILIQVVFSNALGSYLDTLKYINDDLLFYLTMISVAINTIIFIGCLVASYFIFRRKQAI